MGFCLLVFALTAEKIVFVALKAIFTFVFLNRLVTLCTAGLWKWNLAQILGWGGVVGLCMDWLVFVYILFFSSCMIRVGKP
jgi:hypothetical protein